MPFKFNDLNKDIGLGANSLHKYIQAKMKWISDNREEIVTTFIAKWGYEPDRCTWIQQYQADGGTKEYFYRASDEEMELRKRKGIENQEQYRDAFNELLFALRQVLPPNGYPDSMAHANAILKKYDSQED